MQQIRPHLRIWGLLLLFHIKRLHLIASANALIPPYLLIPNAKNLESFFVDSLFGSLDESKTKGNKEQLNEENDKIKVLMKIDSLINNTTKEIDANLAHESLERYLCEWAFLLESDKALSTPISSSSLDPSRLLKAMDVLDYNEKSFQNEKKEARIVQTNSIRIMFRPPPRYLSYSEQRDLEKGTLPDRKGAKLDSKSPGGISIMIHTIERRKGSNDIYYELQLVASRCGIDDDTIIKVSSERTIIRRLKYAIRIWKNVRT